MLSSIFLFNKMTNEIQKKFKFKTTKFSLLYSNIGSSIFDAIIP